LGRVLFVFAKANPPQKNKKAALSITIFLSSHAAVQKECCRDKKDIHYHRSRSCAETTSPKHYSAIIIYQSSFINYQLSFIFYPLISGQVLPNCQKTTIGKGIEKDTL